MACHPDILAYYDKTHPLFLRNILSNNVWCICGCLRYSSSKTYWKEQHKTNSISQVHSSINVSHHINTKRFVSRSTWLQYLNWSIYFQGYIQCVTLLSVLLTMDSIILSFKAKVSPCFSLILFLSRHFMAYLHYDRTNFIDDLFHVMVKISLSGITRLKIE